MTQSHRTACIFYLLLGLLFSLVSQADDKPKTLNPVLGSLAPASGQPGQVITLTGQNFGTQKSKVLFGSITVSGRLISSWSNSQIVGVIPKGSGNVGVQVVAGNGRKSNVLNFSFGQTGTGGLTHFKVFANNDLGMHCVDKDFSVFSILPPYNVVNAQVVGQDASGKPKLLDANSVVLRYSPVADVQGSINSTSRDKTNFWDYVLPLYGANLNPDGQGIKGLYMPADTVAPAKTAFGWNTALGLFSAEGIPILPIDDNGQTNPYPLMRVSAFDKATGVELAHTDTVIPVSDETTCSNCHATGKQAAQGPGWSNAADLDVQSRSNVLKVHDLNQKTDLVNSQPVLCASCHYSPALDLAGNGKPTGNQIGHKWMSEVMHGYHAGARIASVDGKPIYDAAAPIAGLDPGLKGLPPADQQACYQCHPGAETKCLRGAMTDSVTCQNCHGDMKAVGGATAMQAYGAINQRTIDLTRKAWTDEPRCQSCHTGDALNHLIPANATPKINAALASDGIRLMHAYDRNDPAASPLLAGNKRFAENDGKLFRFSKGHQGLSCEGCHGSTHAIWPGGQTHPNDDIAAASLQGHAGTISECTTCHKAGSLPLTLSGPHGMHNVGDSRWASDEDNGHPFFYENQPNECKACHGADLKGSVLSRVAADRTWQTEWGVKALKKGEAVSCYTCHNGPNGD